MQAERDKCSLKPSDPKDIPEAHRINDLHNAGKDDEIPYVGMMLTTVVAEAAIMLKLENGPDIFDMRLSAVKIGHVAIIGIPGEPFTGIGVGLKATEGFDMVIPCLQLTAIKAISPCRIPTKRVAMRQDTLTSGQV